VFFFFFFFLFFFFFYFFLYFSFFFKVFREFIIYFYILTFFAFFFLFKGRDPTRGLRSAIAELEREILPQAIGLTDAFGFTDYELDSALGVKDGRAYENIFERAQLEPLNQEEVTDGYEEFIKPVLERGRNLVEKGRAKL